MKIKTYLLRGIACVWVLSCFTMCTKKINKIDEQLNSSSGSTPGSEAIAKTAATSSINPETDCTYTVGPTQWFVDGATLPAGTVICIPAGTRGSLLLKNLKGTPTEPIVIINKGGKVTFTASATASYVFKTQNCRYFKVLGNGDEDDKYGFDVNGGNIGMTMDDLSSDFEIANVEVRNSGFAGIMAKTDPSCDPATWRGNFTMQNVILRNNYIHNTGGEGVYVGNSFYAEGRSLACGKVLPHDVVNVKIYNNRIDSTGCEGIQVGCAIAGCAIYHNTVKWPGLSPFASGQNNGIQIGEGTGGKCYSNHIRNAPGNGIIVLGLGDNLVYNNYIIDSGAYGIFADSRYTPGPYFRFINNTIVNPALDGIKINSETIPMNFIVNNVMIIPGARVGIKRMSTEVNLTALNNFVSNDINDCKFVNFNGSNFHLLPSSPLINAGANVLALGVNMDYYDVWRPSGGTFDIGATEY